MKKSIKRTVLLLICMAVMCSNAGCRRGFDAAGYTRALLNLTFQGETKEALQIIDGATNEMLMLRYQETVDAFTTNVITSQFEINEAKQEKYAKLVAKIFSVMRYEVSEAEKTGKREYEVAVTIWPADVFVKFHELLVEDSLKMAENIQNGKYTGTEEDIDSQIMADIVNHAYELLDTAYMRVDYGAGKTVILTVKADKKNEYYIEEEDMNNLIEKILRLDEM